NFSLEEWQEEEKEYAQQASKIARRVLMVNSLSEDPVSHGGTFDLDSGEIRNKVPYDVEDILMVEL
ncbi:MAG: carbon-nitrogen hydrolase family protein, partial [Clostridia bacterium]|nr:carbon-nitrogen hydrolase family protein [Clostridia bacterium]